MATAPTVSIEERLTRLESLLERLIAVTPAASNTSTAAAAAVSEPTSENNVTATNRNTFNAANISAIFDDPETLTGPTPRLSYSRYYPNKFKVPKPKSVESQFKLAKVVTNGNKVGVARHVCTICNKILWSKKQRTIHNRFRCKKGDSTYKFKIL
jgi:hypothetical protein